MTNILMVPIHLDALYLENEQSVVEAMADFSRLPYFNGQRDVNPDIANISEEIVSQPFQNQNLPLKAGVHLHWALPDALTKGIHKEKETTFPPVPNRWLITRHVQGKIEKQWVVESDYLYPEGEGSELGSVSIPFHKTKDQYQPFRYLGRKMPLDIWPENNQSLEYWQQLTAVGYGEPTFAAFYPNCHSVFGFYDDDYSGNIPNELTYDVIGWYGNADQDYLRIFSNSVPSNQDILKAIREEFKWEVKLENTQEKKIPEQMLCYARLTFKPSNDTGNSDKEAAVEITVGNTGTEALSAYLAQHIDTNSKAIIEDQLEALHLSPRLENRQLDIGSKFKEARHEKGFNAVPSGCLWTVIQETEPAVAAANADDAAANADDAHKREQIPLPEEMAHQLNRVNILQQAYDHALDEIESMRKQIFADWYKYMLCAYPPEGSRDDYPDIDEVRYYVEKRGIVALDRKITRTGKLMLQKDTSVNKITAASASSDSQPASLANQLAAAINGLITAITTYNNSKLVKDAKATYTLKPTPAPRYWQPKEPVVLITGDDLVQATQRHGQDGRLSEDGLLNCQIFSPDTPIQELILRKKFTAIQQKIDEIQNSKNEKSIAFSTWTKNPWHPFLLEWEVEIFPTENQGNLDPASRNYNSDFIASNYKLTEKEPDICFQEGNTKIKKAANVYSGRSILTPHAGIQLKNQIEAYLKKQLIDDYQAVKEQALKSEPYKNYFETFENWYKKHNLSDDPSLIKDWYDSKPIYNKEDPTFVFSKLSNTEKNNDPIYTAIRAYQVLKNLNCLSQVLSGFNEALLMHKQTLQLEIADPLGFDDYQKFTENVRNAVQNSNRSAPEPLNDFNPIRSGVMEILKLRLVDTFGQVRELDVSRINTTEVMKTPENDYRILLPPRLVQPARLNFRWLSASQGEQEMNDHPATTPICGWVLPNNLDNSLMIYDSEGKALGSINRLAKWEPAQGVNTPTQVDTIANPHLKKMVGYLSKRGSDFLEKFIDALNEALENIEPESFAQHQGLALLMGRPLALVRASLNLELECLPAINQDWNCFRQDLRRNTRDDDDFTRVEFPIRIGEYHQLNDGLVGYWKETENGYEDNIFYAPQTDNIQNEYIKSHSKEPLNICQSIEAPPQILTMLIDPRGKVHATSGILPTKVIDIPPEQYAEALQKIEITFLSTPILTNSRQMSLPLPVEPGYTWSWLGKEKDDWKEIAIAPSIEQQVFQTEFGKVIWNHLLDKSIGWLIPIQNNALQATVVAKDKRKSPHLGEELQKLEENIENILIQYANASKLNQQAFLEQMNVAIAKPLWNYLLDRKWLQALDGSKSKASVVPKDSREPSLQGNFAGLEGQIEMIFDLYALRITPVSTKAEFYEQQAIREGWLKLK